MNLSSMNHHGPSRSRFQGLSFGFIEIFMIFFNTKNIQLGHDDSSSSSSYSSQTSPDIVKKNSNSKLFYYTCV
jgi:hypothetical protein